MGSGTAGVVPLVRSGERTLEVAVFNNQVKPQPEALMEEIAGMGPQRLSRLRRLSASRSARGACQYGMRLRDV